MTYETYSFLTSCLDNQVVKLERDFQMALTFIPYESYKSGTVSGHEKAYKVFTTKCAELRRMKDELKAAVQMVYKNHPNPKMREFWGVEETQSVKKAVP
jgi:hypothetical protein